MEKKILIELYKKLFNVKNESDIEKALDKDLADYHNLYKRFSDSCKVISESDRYKRAKGDNPTLIPSKKEDREKFESSYKGKSKEIFYDALNKNISDRYFGIQDKNYNYKNVYDDFITYIKGIKEYNNDMHHYEFAPEDEELLFNAYTKETITIEDDEETDTYEKDSWLSDWMKKSNDFIDSSKLARESRGKVESLCSNINDNNKEDILKGSLSILKRAEENRKTHGFSWIISNPIQNIREWWALRSIRKTINNNFSKSEIDKVYPTISTNYENIKEIIEKEATDYNKIKDNIDPMVPDYASKNKVDYLESDEQTYDRTIQDEFNISCDKLENEEFLKNNENNEKDFIDDLDFNDEIIDNDDVSEFIENIEVEEARINNDDIEKSSEVKNNDNISVKENIK